MPNKFHKICECGHMRMYHYGSWNSKTIPCDCLIKDVKTNDLMMSVDCPCKDFDESLESEISRIRIKNMR